MGRERHQPREPLPPSGVSRRRDGRLGVARRELSHGTARPASTYRRSGIVIDFPPRSHETPSQNQMAGLLSYINVPPGRHLVGVHSPTVLVSIHVPRRRHDRRQKTPRASSKPCSCSSSLRPPQLMSIIHAAMMPAHPDLCNICPFMQPPRPSLSLPLSQQISDDRSIGVGTARACSPELASSSPCCRSVGVARHRVHAGRTPERRRTGMAGTQS